MLVETAEDETVIISKCDWDVRRDKGWGCCGQEGKNHQCDPVFVHVIGDDDNAYVRLFDAFRNNRMAGFARVILLIQPIKTCFHLLSYFRLFVISLTTQW